LGQTTIIKVSYRWYYRLASGLITIATITNTTTNTNTINIINIIMINIKNYLLTFFHVSYDDDDDDDGGDGIVVVGTDDDDDGVTCVCNHILVNSGTK